MIYKILLVLGYLVYWAMESQSEAWTWLSSWHSTEKIPPKPYHLLRLPETLAIIESFLLNGYVLFGNKGLLVMAISTVTGVIIYERLYCLRAYNNFWYQKTSKWLGFNHPPLWLEIVLFTISIVLIAWQVI